MDNHYHLVIETPDANLSKGMRQLNGVYTQRFNKAHDRVGHVFQGRYKAILVEKDAYLLELARYVVLNPVRAEMVRSAQDWPWSSYRATAGYSLIFEWLTVDWLLAAFAATKKAARKRYSKFVSEGKGQPSPWKKLRNQVYLGDDEFVKRMVAMIDGDEELSEIPKTQRRAKPQTLDFYSESAATRNAAIVEAYLSGGYTLKELGDYFGLHYSTVSGVISNHKSKT
jgi:hypothetical protein